ncbi:MAG: putative bifunctional diguanylate cyclase/phosphodiesterase [Vitreoscilla sp.]
MPSSKPAATSQVTSPLPQAEWATFGRLVQVYRGLDTESAEIRARLVQWVTFVSPWLMAFNILGAVSLALTLPTLVPAWLRWSWCGLICAMCALVLAGWLRHRHKTPTRVSPGVVLKSALHAGALAALWATLPWTVFPDGSPLAQLLIVGVMLGMVAGGGFVLSPLAPAAVVYTVIIGVSTCAAVARLHDPKAMLLTALMAGYTIVTVAAVFLGARRSAGALRAEREAERQGQLVALLLKDFESQSADVMWETDASGRLVRITPKLTALMRLDETASRRSLLGWFERQAGDAEAKSAVSQLRQAFTAGQAFRQRGIPVVVGGSARRWSITARPLVDEAGLDQGWRGVITDITLEHDAQSRMQQLALVDSLTGLANRTQLRDKLQLKLGSAATRPAALLCLNMDHFKRVNDMFGHAAGDVVLRETARRLRKLVRASDVVARAGGDEFALLLDDVASEEDALRFGQRVVAELNRGFTSDSGIINSGASVGVVAIPAHGTSVDELLANADLALSAAKAGGRARAEIFRTDMGERLRLRMTMERDLRVAVARKELRLHWQPQVDTARWRVSGCEALLRWQHGELGLVPPMNFIPLAEETGLIVELGAWVLGEACRVGAQKLPGLMVAVNVSPIQVVRDDFVNVVRKALAASGLPAQRLEIEITESLFIDASPKALRNLEALRQMGVRVALDDFGTGYSSLAYLRQFPFDTLKIDRAFVRELVTQHDARAIVRSIVDLASALGMGTVAEGVEEPAQYELLRRAGCVGVQGFLIARPMPIDQVTEMIESWAMQRAPKSDSVPDSIFAPLDDAAPDEPRALSDGSVH